ncbi:MAG: ABC transporter substrate-binding protein, partial [Bacteroidota bacterium]
MAGRRVGDRLVVYRSWPARFHKADSQEARLAKVGILMAATLLFANVATTAGTASAAQRTLSVFVGLGTGNAPEQIPPQEEVAKAFETAHPDVDVKFEHVDWAVHNAKFTAALAAGKPYDMALPTGFRGFHEFSMENVWLPIDDLLQRDKVDLSSYSRDLINLFRWQGKLYMIPIDYYTDALYYNADLFDEAGLPPPTTKWNDPNWTWEAVVAVAKKLTRDINGDGKIDQWGLEGVGNMEAFEVSFGAREYSDDGRTAMFNTPDMIAAYRFYQSLFWEHHVRWHEGEDVSEITTQRWPFFLSGKIGMSVLASYNLKDMLAVGGKFRWDL